MILEWSVDLSYPIVCTFKKLVCRSPMSLMFLLSLLAWSVAWEAGIDYRLLQDFPLLLLLSDLGCGRLRWQYSDNRGKSKGRKSLRMSVFVDSGSRVFAGVDGGVIAMRISVYNKQPAAAIVAMLVSVTSTFEVIEGVSLALQKLTLRSGS